MNAPPPRNAPRRRPPACLASRRCPRGSSSWGRARPSCAPRLGWCTRAAAAASSGRDTPTREQQSGVAREQDGSSSRASEPTDAASLATPAREAARPAALLEALRREREDSLLAEIETLASATHAGRLRDAGAEGGAEGGAEAMDAAPDSPAMPLRALLPDGSVDANPIRRADDVAVSRATGTLGIVTTSSTTRGREEETSTTFVLRTRAAVVGVVLRVGADGVAAAGDGVAAATLTLSTGDDVPAVSSADATVSSVTTWTLGAPRVGIGESRSNDDNGGDDDDDDASDAPTTTQRRALRGGEVFAVVLAEPTPPCRVVRLTARNVSSGDGARGSDAGDIPLDLASARFVVRPTFPANTPSLVGSPNGEGLSDPAIVSSAAAADFADPTRDAVARLSSRPEVARALEDSAPDHGIRSRTPVAFEEAHSNGSVLHVGFPPAKNSERVSSLSPDPQPRAQPWVIGVYALAEEEQQQQQQQQQRHGVSLGGDPLGSSLGSSLMGGPMSFEPPLLPEETLTHLGRLCGSDGS